jgi:dienelactone hydrolase
MTKTPFFIGVPVMSHSFAVRTRIRALPAFLAALALGAMALASAAQATGFERGPAPTQTSLAGQGPYGVTSARVASPAGFGSATVYYPTSASEGRFGLIGLAPGFLSGPGLYTWLATRLASHGFVVVNVGTKTIFDPPDARGVQLLAALKQVSALAQAGSVSYAAVTDTARQAVMGHSAGGGGALTAARDTPGLKAAIPMTPASNTADFSGVQVPTLILACEKDAIAPNKTYSAKYYPTLQPSLPRAYMEIAAADHLCPTSLAKAAVQNTVAKTVISWLKRHVDEDRRYLPFITGAAAPIYSVVDVRIGE